MTALYPGTSVSGYNSNPPPDDGTTVSTNLITWAGIKTKLGDPLNTFATAIDSNLTSAFGKTLDGATVVSTGTNYAMTAADQGRLIKATASAITITTPDAGTVGAPFVFSINNQSTGTITLAGNATNSQTVDGQTSQVIQSGGGCVVKTDGTNWFTYGLKPAQVSSGGNSSGVGLPVNVGLVASVGSNLLTVALKTVAGNDPSAGDAVLIPFRDTTIANGDTSWVSVTSALSINTNATGATLGTQSSNVPFRLWVVAFNNAGTVVLALWHSGAGASPISINALNPGVLTSTTGISSGATSSGTFYTPNGTSLSSKAYCILGYLDYSTGLTTAGTYAAVPTSVQLFGPGIRKPGEPVQLFPQATANASNVQTASATVTTTGLAQSVVLTSAVNILGGKANLNFTSGTNGSILAQFGRNSNAHMFGSIAGFGSSGSTNGSGAIAGYDLPGTTSSTTYGVYISGNSNGSFNGFSGGGIISTMELQEIMA